jgi:mRNA-degrading endonuclease RelE of RelBE toxin-antitoxin system
MVRAAYEPSFKKKFLKLGDARVQEKIKKQIRRIVENPEVGKPMRHSRKDTREVHVRPFRLSYKYQKSLDLVIFADFYHKDEQ